MRLREVFCVLCRPCTPATWATTTWGDVFTSKQSSGQGLTLGPSLTTTSSLTFFSLRPDMVLWVCTMRRQRVTMR